MASPPGSNRRRRPKRKAPLTVEARAKRVLEELHRLGQAIGRRHGVSPEDLPDAALNIPARLLLNGEIPDGEIESLVTAVDARVAAALKAGVAYRAGRVYCFLCGSIDCTHAMPSDVRETFAGYRPTGKPKWQTFTNLCIERGEARVDRLFGDAPEIIALVQPAAELKEGVMAGFGKGSLVYNVLGQVVCGLIPANLDTRRPSDTRVALTLQIVEVCAGDAERRLRLNILGLTLEDVVNAATVAQGRGPAEAIRRTIRTTRERIRAEARRLQAEAKRGERPDVEARLEPLLVRIRGDLERCFRPLRRRTRHAQQRHEDGERPTSTAMADASGAPNERFLRDLKRDTIVVLGPKSRAHIFSPEGRHVTSLQLRPGELDRKTEHKRWRHMSTADIEDFRQTLA